MRHFILTIFLICASITIAYAQTGSAFGSNSKKPIEISADKTLEWHQQDKQYIANGKAEATQGDVTISAEKIIADYRDDNKGGNVEIWQLTAEKIVQIKNTDGTISGDKAIYNVDSGVATLTGNNLKLVTPDQVITAQERMEYDTIQGIAKAIGNAKIVRGSETLSANNITATFTKDANGKQILKIANANGSVIIETPTEMLIGDHGIYNAVDNTAEVKGNVKVIRGRNMLEGDRAEVNLTTNVSKMFGAPHSGKRVKGVFFLGSRKEDNIKMEGRN